jgi:hypothetical protein
MSILITGAANSAAYRLARLLDYEDVFFADVVEVPSIPGRKIRCIPDPSSTSYAHKILTFCLDNGIYTIYPLHLNEVLELSKARQLFLEYGISVIIPSDEWLKNNSNVSPFNPYNIVVLEKGIVRAVGSADAFSDILKEGNGIFNWILKEGKIIYSLFVVEEC